MQPTPTVRELLIKFLVMILNLLTSRKFWLWASAEATSYSLYVNGEISAQVFLAAFVSGVVALMAGIVAEDIAIKMGSAKIVASEVAVTGMTRKQIDTAQGGKDAN